MRHHFCTGDKQTSSQTLQQRSTIEIPDLWEEELEQKEQKVSAIQRMLFLNY